MKKVLALGYIPKWKGGQQKTGLATGLFDLHDAVNSLKTNVEVVIAATDIYQKEKRIDNTRVLGWSKKILMLTAIKHFYRLPKFIYEAFRMAKYKPTTSFALMLAKILFLDYAITKEHPDIVHLHGCIYAMFRTAIWDKSVKVVLRLHGINGHDKTIAGYDQYRKMEQYITSLPFEFVTFVTGGICEEWKDKYGIFNCPMIPLINGYNSEVFYLPEKEIKKEYDLVTFSGLQERKGQDRVIKALKRMKDEGITLSYLVIGSGSKEYENYIHSLATNWDLPVTFISYLNQNELLPYLWKSSFFILPSVTEGFGKVYVESAGAGIPVILPKTLPIMKEKDVLNSNNSILTRDETDNSIYEVLKRLGEFPFNQASVAQSVGHLKWSSLAKKYINLYNSLT